MVDLIANFKSKAQQRSQMDLSKHLIQPAARKNALVSYITEPIRMGPDYKPFMFSNAGIARNIVKVLVDMGYIVDLIDWNSNNFKSNKIYDLFIGHGGFNWEYLSRNIVDDAVKVYFSTSLYWKKYNPLEAERFKRLKNRRGVQLPYDRWIKSSEEYALHDADGIISLGNQFVSASYSDFPLNICINSGVHSDDSYNLEEKNFEAGRRHFLYFGSSGNIHKGLDLLAEAFMKLDAELWCAGEIEPGFAQIYKNDLAQHPNIHLVGWVDLRSPLFYKLVNRCNCTIFASCAEGCPGGVLECMNQGLIPIVSRGSCLDVENFGIILENDSIEEIITVVREVMAKPEQWHREHSIKTRQAVLHDFSEWNFYRNIHSALEKIIEQAPHVREQRAKNAEKVINDPIAFLSANEDNVGMLLRGTGYLNSQGRVDEAAELLQRAIALEPSCATAICELGIYFANKGQLDKSIGLIKRALEVCPGDKQCRALLQRIEPAATIVQLPSSLQIPDIKLTGSNVSTIFTWKKNDYEYLLESCNKDEATSYILKYLPKSGKIVEAGCGLGRYVKNLSERGYNIEGIEYSEETVRMVKEKDAALKVIQADVLKMPYQTNSIDGIISLGVVEHFVLGPHEALREMYRVLKPEGIAIITVPSLSFIRQIKRHLYIDEIKYYFNSIRTAKRLNIVRRFLNKKPVKKTNLSHNRNKSDLYMIFPTFGIFFEYVFRKKQFEDAISECGFTIIESVPIGHMDGVYHEFGKLFVTFKNWKFHPNVFGRLLNALLSKIPFCHNHMHLCVVKKN